MYNRAGTLLIRFPPLYSSDIHGAANFGIKNDEILTLFCQHFSHFLWWFLSVKPQLHAGNAYFYQNVLTVPVPPCSFRSTVNSNVFWQLLQAGCSPGANAAPPRRAPRLAGINIRTFSPTTSSFKKIISATIYFLKIIH